MARAPRRAAAVIAAVGLCAWLARGRRNTPGQDGVPPQDNDTAPATPTADDLDKELLDQLHAATLKAADSCFELKKLCATILVPAGVLVATFSGKQLNPAVFVTGFVIIVAFWIADAFSFYYQRRLRVLMKEIWTRRAARCPDGYRHVQDVGPVGWFGAAFNSSMIYYLLLTVVIGLAWAAYSLNLLDAVGTSAP